MHINMNDGKLIFIGILIYLRDNIYNINILLLNL